MLTFTGTNPCILCGFHLRGFRIQPARVNKASIRATGTAIGAEHRWCPECGTPTIPTLGNGYRLHPESRAELDAYRARKWGA